MNYCELVARLKIDRALSVCSITRRTRSTVPRLLLSDPRRTTVSPTLNCSRSWALLDLLY